MSNYKQRGRTELALLYNPDLDSRTAWRRLSAWIDQCEPLSNYPLSRRTVIKV